MKASSRGALKALLVVTLFCLPAFSAEITGTVTNQTTGKPSAGDDVVLLKLVQSMEEVARTKTDAQGRFTVAVADNAAPHLVRVNHRNVNYFRSAPPGTTSVEVNVYDASETVEGIKQSVDIMRLEADATSLRVVQMYSLNNESKPPRTLMSMKSFEMVLPEGAKLEQSLAAGPGGMPVTTAPVPTGEKNRYAFLFPIRPGETRFQVAYTMPYNGSAQVTPVLLRPVENFAVSAPPSMKVEPLPGSRLQASGEEAGMTVYVAQNAAPSQSLGFKVSGTGTIPTTADPNQTPAADGSRGPGGGLGTPINTPDPLYKYRWWIIAGVALLLVAGAAFTLGTPQKATPVTAVTTAGAAPASMLETLKEESFQLESERMQGKITAEEYTSARAALDVVIKRAMAREKTDAV